MSPAGDDALTAVRHPAAPAGRAQRPACLPPYLCGTGGAVCALGAVQQPLVRTARYLLPQDPTAVTHVMQHEHGSRTSSH